MVRYNYIQLENFEMAGNLIPSSQILNYDISRKANKETVKFQWIIVIMRIVRITIKILGYHLMINTQSINKMKLNGNQY